MLIIEINYSKKLGLPGYSSHQYSVTLRSEIADVSQVSAKSQELYGLMQSCVDREIQQTGFLPNANGNRHSNGNQNGNGGRNSRRQQFEIDKLKQVFEAGWADQGTKINWDGEEPDQKSSAWAVLEKYFTDTPIKADEMPEAVEVQVEADLTKHGLPVLIGVLDLVRSGGRITDFKSAAKTPDHEMALHQNGVQLDCYSVLYREATGKRESARELHHLIKTKVPKLVITETGPMTEHQQNRLFRLMEDYVDGLGRGDFIPSPGFGCMGCEFLNECWKWDGGRH